MNDVSPRFSRKALNILIFITAGLILVFSQMGPDEDEVSDQVLASESEAASEVKVSSHDLEHADAPKKDNLQDFFPELTGVPEIPEAEVNLEIQTWVTEEGLSVYYAPSPELPMVDIRVVFDGGSARDPDRQAGLASLTSNLLQLATEGKSTTEVAQELEMLGAQMKTSSYRDMALASLRVLSEEKYLEPSLALFGQVLSEPVFSDADFTREMNRQKIGIARKQQSPHALIGDAVFDVLYGASHPYGEPGSGTLESLETIDQSDIRRFHGEYYVARNGLLAIVGNVSREQAEVVADSISVRLKPGNKAPALVRQTKKVDEVHHHIDFESDQTHLALVGAGVYRGHKDYYALYLTNHILGGSGFASLLNKTIRQEKAYAYSVSSGVSPMAAIGPVSIQMQTRSDQAAAAIAATQQVVDSIVKNGVSEDVLADAKQQILSEFALRAASNSSQLGYLGVIGFHKLPLNYLSTFNENISKITEDEIRTMASRYFKNMAIVTLGSLDPIGE